MDKQKEIDWWLVETKKKQMQRNEKEKEMEEKVKEKGGEGRSEESETWRGGVRRREGKEAEGGRWEEKKEQNEEKMKQNVE